MAFSKECSVSDSGLQQGSVWVAGMVSLIGRWGGGSGSTPKNHPKNPLSSPYMVTYTVARTAFY